MRCTTLGRSIPRGTNLFFYGQNYFTNLALYNYTPAYPSRSTCTNLLRNFSKSYLLPPIYFNSRTLFCNMALPYIS